MRSRQFSRTRANTATRSLRFSSKHHPHHLHRHLQGLRQLTRIGAGCSPSAGGCTRITSNMTDSSRRIKSIAPPQQLLFPWRCVALRISFALLCSLNPHLLPEGPHSCLYSPPSSGYPPSSRAGHAAASSIVIALSALARRTLKTLSHTPRYVPSTPDTSIAFTSMRVRRNGTRSGNLSRERPRQAVSKINMYNLTREAVNH